MDQGLPAPELLHTKMTPPQPRPLRVVRSTLLSRLDTGFAHKLTLLSAPAGAGKTTLVSAWLSSRHARENAPPVAWVTLDDGDNDPMRFWRYVLTACQTFPAPGDAPVGQAALAHLPAVQPPELDSLLTRFINDLGRLRQPALLVLEDFHTIHAPLIHSTVTFLLDYMPSSLHLFLLTRHDPPLPLARLRAEDQLVELRGADLRFDRAETELFLEQNLTFSLSVRAIDRLVERTEGWVAGLQLVTLALRRRPTLQAAEAFLETMSGSLRHILDYLADEVLAAQPAARQEFLLQTSVLQRLTASLCDAVTGRDDSDQMLAHLQEANLFLIPLDEAHVWYRYHPLFAEAMQQVARRRLGEEQLIARHEIASRWYEQQGYLTDAIEAALSAHAYTRAAELIERITGAERANSELYTTRRWIEALPQPIWRVRPALCFAYAVALLFTSDRRAPATLVQVEEPLQIAEQQWLAQEDEPQLGRLFALRAMLAFWQGAYHRSFAAARQALDLLPEQDIYWRSNSLFHIGLAHLFAGRVQAAQPLIEEARVLFAASNNAYGERAAGLVLGELHIVQGELHQAEQFFRQVLEAAGEDRQDQSHALIGLATLAYEWNDLDTAERHAGDALAISQRHAAELGEQLAAATLTLPAELLLAQVEQARGRLAQARKRLHALEPQTAPSPLAHQDVQSYKTRLAMAAGDLASAQRWIRQTEQVDDDTFPSQTFPSQQERVARIRARLEIAHGNTDAAVHRLDPWLASAREQGRVHSEIALLVLMALAHSAAEAGEQAQEWLAQAVDLARPGGYQRIFLDEGARLAALVQDLYATARTGPLGGYLRRLLLAFGAESPPAAPVSAPAAAPIEPLSPQEQKVLRLLAAGLTNPEIAREQVVSVNTIKTQVQSIYRKLDVHSREEATDVAHSLGLL